MILSVVESLKVVRAVMSLLCQIRYRKRGSLLMIMCLDWSMENLRALDIVASHESSFLIGQFRME